MPLLIIELDESIWLVLIACCCVGELDKVGYHGRRHDEDLQRPRRSPVTFKISYVPTH